MYNFILKNRPLSYNSCKGSKKINYRNVIHNAFVGYNPDYTLMTGEIYATIYYFFNKNLDLDTDNLSKPVWDSLCNFLYNDDQQIKIRIAGSFDLSTDDYSIIDLSDLQGDLIVDLLDSFDSEDHTVYIECGNYKPSLLKFNIE